MQINRPFPGSSKIQVSVSNFEDHRLNFALVHNTGAELGIANVTRAQTKASGWVISLKKYYLVENNIEDEKEDEDYEGMIIFAAVNQLKDKRKVPNIIQLIADMVKISGDLAVKSVIERNLLQHIVMYGLIIDCNTEKADVLKLTMDFENRRVVIVQSEEQLEVEECFERLDRVL